MIGIAWPERPSPMRRLKKRSTSPGLPTEKKPAFSRKKGRFSGKNSANRSRFTCWSSTSTWAKSVFTVPSSARLGVRLNFRSPPTSPDDALATGRTPEVMALPSANGISLKLRSVGVRMPLIDPASDTR